MNICSGEDSVMPDAEDKNANKQDNSVAIENGNSLSNVDKPSKGSEVWLIGHSFIHWARERAQSRLCGLQLGISQETKNIQLLDLSDEDMNFRFRSNNTTSSSASRNKGNHSSQVIHQLRLSENESAALQELMDWRRKLCEESEDCQKDLNQTDQNNAAPTQSS
ncbi:hypothetical protein FKM82_009042 [Ascaphus truei]